MRTGDKSLPENIEELIPNAQDILERHPNIIFAYLFGGLAKGRISPVSDIDIAVYLANVDDILEVKLEILSLLSDTLNTDEIDLVILNTAPLPLRARIIQNKKVLVDKDPALRYSFESLVLREYFDFSIKERAIFSRRYNLGR
ncbi:MAG TPA: nucleotidyltransferase domain-containing protein [bacterium]|nr:nucleotidyltransferase domain-containing protein [bacterium]HPO82278.1 nucleotidyltransferase domain-containing protein [bacterium]